MELLPHLYILAGAFALATVLGWIIRRTDFCTLGAVSDWVNMGERTRMRAWWLAIAVAVLGVALLESWGLAQVGDTRPPYRSPVFAWPRYLLGGLMFGCGMALAGGCTTKNLVRLGGGNLKSLVVLVTVGMFAWLMTRTGFYGAVFHPWIDPISVDLTRFGVRAQDPGGLLAPWLDPAGVRLWAALLVAGALLLLSVGRQEFRSQPRHVLGAVGVGAAVAAAWYLTGGPAGEAWRAEVEWWPQPPRGVGVQSFTFVNPLGETLEYLGAPGQWLAVTFGVMAVAGVILGALAQALWAGDLRREWFASAGDVARNVCGGILMGIGGVLALGCTTGQGLTGVSTLALGSWLAFGAFIAGSALTMKTEYYKMVYEDAGWNAALLSALADLHLVPAAWRRLDPV